MELVVPTVTPTTIQFSGDHEATGPGDARTGRRIVWAGPAGQTGRRIVCAGPVGHTGSSKWEASGHATQ
jgi:hypothetical protein